MRKWHWAFDDADAFCLTDARARAFAAGGGDEGVLAVDGVSDRLRALWPSTCYPAGLFADSVLGKLYCLYEWPYIVSVIDPSTNGVPTTVPLSGYPEAVSFNTADRKVYVAGAGDECGFITVLDGAGDTLVAEITLGNEPSALAYDATDDMLYAAERESYFVKAISGAADSVVDSFFVREYSAGLVYNEARQRLYSLGSKDEVTVFTPGVQGKNNYIGVGTDLRYSALNSCGTKFYCGSPNHESVYVVDCVGETLARAIPVTGPPVALCYDHPHDRLYSAGFVGAKGWLSVIDCAKDTVVATIPVTARFLYYDSTSDAVYCLGNSTITVVDGETWNIVRTFAMNYPVGIASAPGWPCVYVALEEEPYLSVLHKGSGPAEMQVQAAADAQATLVRGSLDWTGTLAVMYDMGGRRVADVHRGGNDVSRLRPGVYFVRQNGVRPGTYARKIVITR